MRKKPKFVFLLPSLTGGGAERVASVLVPYFQKNFDLEVVILYDSISYKLPPKTKLRVLSKDSRRSLIHIIRIPFHVLSLSLIVKQSGAKCVLSFLEQANIINLLSSVLTRHSAVISQRTNPTKQYEHKELLGKMILTASKLFYKNATAICTVSRELSTLLSREYRIPLEKLHFIPNPVQIDEVEKAARVDISDVDKPYILHVGRIRLAAKAQDMLVEAFSAIQKDYPELSLVFIGDGPDRERLEAKIQSYRLGHKVKLLGRKENPFSYMSNALMLVLPSLYEGWPNVLVEAMACGCPVIASSCKTGPEEILENGRYGVLFPTGDTKALERAIRRMLDNERLREKLKKLGKERARDFEAAKVAEMYSSILRNYVS